MKCLYGRSIDWTYMYIGCGKCPLVCGGGTRGGGLGPDVTVTFGAWYGRECVPVDGIEWGGTEVFGA